MRIGLVSDTHGALPIAAEAALAGVDAIVHAGDAGSGVIGLLEAIAPVTVVRDKRDTAGGSPTWPTVANVRFGPIRLIVAHRAETLVDDLEPARAGARVAVVGHTHVGRVEDLDGVLWVNPGSPVTPRQGAPASVAILEVAADGAVSARIVPLP